MLEPYDYVLLLVLVAATVGEPYDSVLLLVIVGVTVGEPYDYAGAMYFAVAVILIYGISIAFLIGTTLRKSQQVKVNIQILIFQMLSWSSVRHELLQP